MCLFAVPVTLRLSGFDATQLIQGNKGPPTTQPTIGNTTSARVAPLQPAGSQMALKVAAAVSEALADGGGVPVEAATTMLSASPSSLIGDAGASGNEARRPGEASAVSNASSAAGQAGGLIFAETQLGVAHQQAAETALATLRAAHALGEVLAGIARRINGIQGVEAAARYGPVKAFGLEIGNPIARDASGSDEAKKTRSGVLRHAWSAATSGSAAATTAASSTVEGAKVAAGVTAAVTGNAASATMEGARIATNFMGNAGGKLVETAAFVGGKVSEGVFSEDESGEEEPMATPVHNLSPAARVHGLQLSWIHGGLLLDKSVIAELIANYNREVRNIKGAFTTENRGGLAGQSAAAASKGGLSIGATSGGKPLQAPDYEQVTAKRQLLELQDTNTGSLRVLDINSHQEAIMRSILMVAAIVNERNSTRRGAASVRVGVIRDFARMLGVDQSVITTLFNLVLPSRTQDAQLAVVAFGKEYLPPGVMQAVRQVTYSVRRAIPVYTEIRKVLWEVAWHFRLPRFIGPAILLPALSYPPEIREIGSIAHFFMAPVLKEDWCNARLQFVLYNLMGLISGAAPSADKLVSAFGMSQTLEVTNLLYAMMRPAITDKLPMIAVLLRGILDGLRKVSASFVAVDSMVPQMLSYVLYFAGFPNVEVPMGLQLNAPRRAVVDAIAEETGIYREVLSGIELSQRSISPMSSSDETTLNREGVIALLVPMFAKARQARPQRVRDWPSDGLVKALVSLAYRQTDNLEYLAESLQPPLDTFAVQLLVLLVDISRRADIDGTDKALQQIRVSAGIMGIFSNLGVDQQKFISLVELTFPRMNDIRTIPALIDSLGLGQRVAVQWVELLYVAAICVLLHLTNVADPMRHEAVTRALTQALEPICTELGFSRALVPALEARLFHGDFHVLQMGSQDIQLLLPFTLERELATAVCGFLSHRPPEIKYNPVVVDGVVRVKVDSLRGEVEVRPDTLLPSDAAFDFRPLLPENTAASIPASACRFDVSAVTRNRFTISCEFPQQLLGYRVGIFWRAWPKHLDAEGLRERQHQAATAELKRLERSCARLHIDWGGVAHAWWGLGVHPLFLLLAAGDVGAIRLASDLLGVPDVSLAFLLGMLMLGPAASLKPLLLAELCVGPVMQNLVTRRPLQNKAHCLPRSPSRAAAKAKRDQMERPLDLDEDSADEDEDDEEEECSDDDDDGGLLSPDDMCDYSVSRSLSDRPEPSFLAWLSVMRPEDFPDELLELYSVGQAESFQNLEVRMGQALWARWHYGITTQTNEDHCCSGAFFEKAGVDSFSMFQRGSPKASSKPPVPPDARMDRWQLVPENMHLLLLVMLAELHKLLEDTSDAKALKRGPGVAIMACLARLHQARLAGSRIHSEVPASLVEQHLLPAMRALEVHVRTHSDLRDQLVGEAPPESREPWDKGSIWGFKMPTEVHGAVVGPGAAGRHLTEWCWEAWEWPEDEMVLMFCRMAQVARFTLGLSSPLSRSHASERECGRARRMATTTASGKVGNIGAAAAARAAATEATSPTRGWTRLLSTGEAKEEASITQQREKLVMDLLEPKASSLLLAIASSSADSIDRRYSIQQVDKMPKSAKKAGLIVHMELYEAIALAFSTSFDRIVLRYHEASVAGRGVPPRCAGEALWKLLPAIEELGRRTRLWVPVLCCEIHLNTSMTDAMLQIAHGFVEDHGGTLISMKQMENFAKQLQLAQDRQRADVIEGQHFSGARLLQSLCSTRWTMSSVEMLAKRLGLSARVVRATLLAALGDVEGWIELHRLCVLDPAADAEQRAARALNKGSMEPQVLGGITASERHLSDPTSAKDTPKKVATTVLMEDRQKQAGVGRGWAASRAAVVPQLLRGEATRQSSDMFFRACRTFKAIPWHSRHTGKIRKERAWVWDLLSQLLPHIPGSRVGTPPEVRNAVQSTFALALHVLCGQNGAAAQLLAQHEMLVKAVGLTGEGARRFQHFSFLVLQGKLRINKSEITGAALCLSEPLVEYVVSAPEERAVGIPTDDHEDDEEVAVGSFKDQLASRMALLLECIFGIAARDNQSVLNAMQGILALNMRRFLSEHSELLAVPESSIASPRINMRLHKTVRNICIEPLTPEVERLIVQNKQMRTLVMMQALGMIRSLNRISSVGAVRPSGAAALACMVTALHRDFLGGVLGGTGRGSRAGAVQPFQAGATLKPTPSGRGLQSSVEIDGLELRVRSGMDWDDESPKLTSEDSRLKRSQRLGKSLAKLSKDKAVSQAKDFNATKEGKAVNAMAHLFLAFAASDRGKLSGKAPEEVQNFIHEFRRFLPVIAAVATGRIDKVLSTVAGLVEDPKAQEDLCLICDMLTLLGMSKELFLEAVNKALMQGQEMPEFLPHILRRLLNRLPTDWSSHEKEELETIVHKLVALLLALCVDAPLEIVNSLILGLLEPLEKFAKSLLQGDDRMERAGGNLIGAARRMAAMVAQGRSLSKAGLLQPQGNEPALLIVVLEASVDLLLPFMASKIRGPLQELVKVLAELTHLRADPTMECFLNRFPAIAESTAAALSVPKHTISGVVALARGDWAAAVDFCRPFCNLDPKVLEQMSMLLPTVQKTVASGKEAMEKPTKSDGFKDIMKGSSVFAARMKHITGSVSQGKGSASDLFVLIDIDRNGSISEEEFRMCMVRLGYQLNEHRLVEVFSKCKRKLDGNTAELTEQEFKEALEYLEIKIAGTTLSLLGRSWTRLMLVLVLLLFLLALIMAFIFLGMSAFVTGGTFSAIVNSCMTIGAGIGLLCKDTRDTKGEVEDQLTTEAVVEEVKDTVFSEQ